MRTRHIEVFNSIYKTGSVTAAAKLKIRSTVSAERDDGSTTWWNPEPRFVIAFDARGAPRLENRGGVPIPG